MRGRKSEFEYVVYKGDDVICAGTSSEIKQKLNISEGYFRMLTSQMTIDKEKECKDRLIAIKVPISEIVGDQ